MSDAELLDRIRNNPWITERLRSICDFELWRVEYGPVEPVHLAGGEPLEMIAGDASGGAFMLVGSGAERPVVYVGSEGTGGIVGTSLGEALALLVATAGEDLREYEPNLDADRQRLREELDLPPVEGVPEKLHRLAADDAYLPISDAGDRYEPGWY